MLAGLYHDERRRAQQRHATDGEHPSAVAASLGQVKAGVVQHGQRHDGVAIGHSDVLAVDSGGSSQELRPTLLTLTILGGLNDKFNGILEEDVAFIRGGFSHAVAIILQPLNHDVALCIGDKGGCIRLLGGDTLGVIHAILQISDNENIVGVIVQVKLDVLDAPLAIAELLQHINAVSIHMAAVLQSIVVSSVGTLPSQYDFVGIILVAHLCVGGQSGGVGDPHGAVGVATLDAVGIHALGLVDLAQAGFGHLDSHRVLRVIINRGELAGILAPGSDLVGAGGIAEKLDNHIVLVVADALGHGVHIGVLA